MRKASILTVLIVAVAFMPASATIINIPGDYPTIQQGINASSDGDTVLVQPGTYVENIDFNGHNIVLGSLFLTTGDTSYISSTIVDGDSSGSVVTFRGGEDSTAVILGFTVQNGFSRIRGGGIYCSAYSTPIISNNIVKQNTALGQWPQGGGGICLMSSSGAVIINNAIRDNLSDIGAGIYCHDANAYIGSNIIANNNATSRGGGIDCSNGNSIVMDNIISENSAESHGGGICFSNTNSLIINNVIIGNSAQDGGAVSCLLAPGNPIIQENLITENIAFSNGGGIECYYSHATISNNVISNNLALEGRGGGVYCPGFEGVITSNIIKENTAATNGGGIYCADLSQVQVYNNLFEGNSAENGGAIYSSTSSIIISNNSIYSNLASQSGGGLYLATSPGVVYPDINNTIFWADEAQSGPEIYIVGEHPPVAYCNVQGGWEGISIIDSDPMFRDPENGDFHLMAIECGDDFDSPCIDTGHPYIIDSLLDCSWGLGTIRSDIGAYAGGDSTIHSPRIINIPDDYQSIQEGIYLSRYGDTVLAQPGTYIENINFYGHNIVLGSMFLITGDTSYIPSTIIDGDSSGSVVVFNNREDSDAAIIGFTIQNGLALKGGGIYCRRSEPVIINNIIINNAVDSIGGGIFCDNMSKPLIKDNQISANNASDGGGIGTSYSYSKVISNTITNNFTNNNGGGIWGHGFDRINCNNIRDNYAESHGGGIALSEFLVLSFNNNSITNNECSANGGGVACIGGIVDINNNTIYGNHASYGGGLYVIGGTVRVKNTIFWLNTASDDGNQIYDNGASVLNVTYSGIHGGWEGEGNLDNDPLFRDPSSDDFHLQDSIDCGDSLYSSYIDAGHPEILDSLIDCFWGLGTEQSDIGAFGGGDTIPHIGIVINIPEDYPTIQQGINASINRDTVRVAPGIYYENIGFGNKNIVVGSHFMDNGDTSHISNTVIDGSSLDPVVTFEYYNDSSATLVGFTIKHGMASWGGGIVCMSGDPTIKNNIIRNNTINGWYRYDFGAGIRCNYSDATIVDNVIINNSVYNETYYGKGGGISCVDGNPIIKGNYISGNYAQDEGGGIYCLGNSSPIIIGNYIENNQAEWGGGISYHGFSQGVISGNIITDNSTHGIVTRNAVYTNNLIYENLGSGIYCTWECTASLINNTICYNYSDDGGGVFCDWSYPVLVNCILYGNTPGQIGIDNMGYGNPTISYSNIQDGWEGVGNIDADPLFRDWENSDFHLMATHCGYPYDSPCIDAGDPNILDSLLDCDWGLGELRSDMGTYGGGDSVQVGIENYQIQVPDQFDLLQNYPNPFNAQTTIRYELPQQSHVTIEIYDILGRRVTTLHDGFQSAGYYQVIWHLNDISSGVYFYKIQAGDYTETKKMLLLK